VDNIKKYTPRHALQLFRLTNPAMFQCARCTRAKKSRRYALSDKHPGYKLCNRCYGRLVSMLDVENIALPNAKKTDLLADLLLSSFSNAQKQEAERLYRLSEKRTKYLDQKSVTFIATVLALRDILDTKTYLDWSSAIIGFCKAVENEVVLRLLKPLVDKTGSNVPDVERRDKDIGRIARFCQKPTAKPPELGNVFYFLQTSTNSKRRRKTYRVFTPSRISWLTCHKIAGL